MRELHRVLRPGAFLLITTHGEYYLPQLNQEEQRAFKSGRLVTRHEELPGGDKCGAFHPEEYIRGDFCKGFDVIEFIPEGSPNDPNFFQDVILFRKSASIL